jgi:hypothetical protein
MPPPQAAAVDGSLVIVQLAPSTGEPAAPGMLGLVEKVSDPKPGSAPYDPSKLTGGRVTLAYIDPATNEWVELPRVSVDATALTVSATTDHFTSFGSIETFDTTPGATTPITSPLVWADALTNGNAWESPDGGATGPLTAAAGVSATFDSKLYLVKNSGNYRNNITIDMPVNFANNGNSHGGGVIFGYKSTTDYWMMAYSMHDNTAAINHCSGDPCEVGGEVYGVGAPANSKASASWGSSNNTWYWMEITITGTPGNNVTMTGKIYSDGTGGATSPHYTHAAAANVTVTYTTTSATEYQGGQIGMYANSAAGWKISQPQVYSLFPSGWNGCMSGQYASGTSCTDNPGLIYNYQASPADDATPVSGVASIRVFTGTSTGKGMASESVNITSTIDRNYVVGGYVRSCSGTNTMGTSRVCSSGSALSPSVGPIAGFASSGTTTTIVDGTVGVARVSSTTTSAGTTTTLNDSAQSWTTNQWVGYTLEITSGALSGQTRTISGNTTSASGSTITVSSAFASAVASSVSYRIYRQWAANAYANQTVFIGSGTNAGTTGTISAAHGACNSPSFGSGTSCTLTVTSAFTSAIDSTSYFQVGNPPVKIQVYTSGGTLLGQTAPGWGCIAPTSPTTWVYCQSNFDVPSGIALPQSNAQVRLVLDSSAASSAGTADFDNVAIATRPTVYITQIAGNGYTRAVATPPASPRSGVVYLKPTSSLSTTFTYADAFPSSYSMSVTKSSGANSGTVAATYTVNSGLCPPAALNPPPPR